MVPVVLHLGYHTPLPVRCWCFRSYADLCMGVVELTRQWIVQSRILVGNAKVENIKINLTKVWFLEAGKKVYVTGECSFAPVVESQRSLTKKFVWNIEVETGLSESAKRCWLETVWRTQKDPRQRNQEILKRIAKGLSISLEEEVTVVSRSGERHTTKVERKVEDVLSDISPFGVQENGEFTLACTPLRPVTTTHARPHCHLPLKRHVRGCRECKMSLLEFKEGAKTLDRWNEDLVKAGRPQALTAAQSTLDAWSTAQQQPQAQQEAQATPTPTAKGKVKVKVQKVARCPVVVMRHGFRADDEECEADGTP